MQFLIKIIDGLPFGNAIELDNLKSFDSNINAISKSFLRNDDVENFGYGIFLHTETNKNRDLTKHYIEHLPTEKNSDNQWLQKWVLTSIEFDSDSDRDSAIALTDQILSFDAREKRNNLLKDTDWAASSDLNLTVEMADYRTALRDISSQSGFPRTITWPTAP
jgi:hypothetical protein